MFAATDDSCKHSRY